MNYYHIWCNLKDGRRDLEFGRAVAAYCDALRARGLIEDFRVTRRKLGFGPRELGEFHLVLETRDLAQLDRAFLEAARRDGELERLHQAVYSQAAEFRAALYRDFPDPERADGGGA